MGSNSETSHSAMCCAIYEYNIDDALFCISNWLLNFMVCYSTCRLLFARYTATRACYNGIYPHHHRLCAAPFMRYAAAADYTRICSMYAIAAGLATLYIIGTLADQGRYITIHVRYINIYVGSVLVIDRD